MVKQSAGNKGNRWLAYTRVSTTEQATEGTSLEHQQERIEAMARIEGATVTVFPESGRSGGSLKNRPALDSLRIAAERGEGDLVVVTSLDRLSRKAGDIHNLLDEFGQHGIGFKSLRESFDTSSPIGKGMLSLVGIFAELERDLIIERTTNGRISRLREGKWASGEPVKGLARVGSKKLPVEASLSKKEGILEVFEPEAEMVRTIFDLYDGGLSTRGVVRWLQSHGYTTWHESMVGRVLRFPYAGGPYPGLETVTVPHVVRRDVWERTQERLTANHRRKPGKKTPTALQGIVTCGEHCGGKWRISGTRPSRGEIARLYCSHRESPRPGSKQQYAKCVIDRQPLEKMERAILGALRTNFKDYDEHIKLLKSCYRGLGQRLRDIQRGMPGVVKRLEELEEERGRVNHMFEKGSLGEEEFDEKTGLLNSQIQNLRVSIPDMSERERELERVKTYRRQLYQRIQAVKYRKLHDIPLNEVRMFSLEAGYVEDWEHGYVLESEFYPFSRGDYSDQEQLAQAIKLFDIGLVMHPDHVELTGMLPMKIGLSGDEKESPYASHAGSGPG